jgi:sugar phosphate isomerase/epimerase
MPTTRRSFLKQASLAITALMMTKPSDLFAEQKLIGLQLYTVRDEIKKDVAGTVAKVAQAGYNSVEVSGYDKGKFFGLSPEDFLAIIKQNRLKTPSGHYSMDDFLSKGDEDQLKRTVADAAKMGHDFFVIPYLKDEVRTSLDDYKKLAVKLSRAAEEVKKAGMALAYHNHNFEFRDWGGGQTGFEVFKKETDASLVSFEMDFYWVTRAGLNPIKLIKENPGRIKMWHIKDMAHKNKPTFDTNGDQDFTEAGAGIINYKEIFKYKRESGMRYFFVEQDKTKLPVFESISKSFQNVKNNILG